MIETFELAWQAGIVDGEGTLTIGRQIRKDRRSPSFRVTITVVNTDQRILLPFVAAWGGKLYNVHERRKDKRGLKWQDAWDWYCPERVQKSLLLALRPFLKAKHLQALLLLDFLDHKRSYKRYHGSTIGCQRGGSAPLGPEELAYRERIWNEVRSLNSKGQYARAQQAVATEVLQKKV